MANKKEQKTSPNSKEVWEEMKQNIKQLLIEYIADEDGKNQLLIAEAKYAFESNPNYLLTQPRLYLHWLGGSYREPQWCSEFVGGSLSCIKDATTGKLQVSFRSGLYKPIENGEKITLNGEEKIFLNGELKAL